MCLSIKKIYHRDIKPANILLKGIDPKNNPNINDLIIIADFGESK